MQRTFELVRRGLVQPYLSTAERREIVRAAYSIHDVRHNADPEWLLVAEGFRVFTVPMPLNCGATDGHRILLPTCRDPRDRKLRAVHERAHAWLARIGCSNATEADAWLLAMDLAWPSWSLTPPSTEFLPAWFVIGMMTARSDADRGAQLAYG